MSSCRTMVLGSTHALTEISTSNISWGYGRPVCTADKLTTFTCRFSWNLGACTPWKPQGLSRNVQKLLYLTVDSIPFCCAANFMNISGRIKRVTFSEKANLYFSYNLSKSSIILTACINILGVCTDYNYISIILMSYFFSFLFNFLPQRTPFQPSILLVCDILTVVRSKTYYASANRSAFTTSDAD